MNEKVRIPEKYRKALEYRFNPDNAELRGDRYVIDKDCALCADFLRGGCIGCPFDQYREHPDDYLGCVNWVWKVTGLDWSYWTPLVGSIIWQKEDDRKARAQLRKLNREAGKFIEWVKEE